MSEASFASLGPTLLARKGGAKPAMRPQLAPLPKEMTDDALEDLGWNDMGGDETDADDANVVALNAGPIGEQSGSPVVKKQQRDLSERILADAVMHGPEEEEEAPAQTDYSVEAPRAATPKPAPKPAASKGRRAAFTLRLDTDRHLKLRFAATMKGVSAQALVTEALDLLLEDIDDLNALAERMKRN